MAEELRFNYMPDADRILTKDRMRDKTVWIFQVETRIEITEDLWKDMDDALNGANPDFAKAYSLLYQAHHDEMDLDGNGHATVQAALGVLHVDKAQASAALRRHAENV